MLLASQVQHLAACAPSGVDPGGKVVELGHLPAAGLGDPPFSPVEDIIVPTQLRHGFGHPDELVWRTQLAAEQSHDPINVPIKEGQALFGVLGGERCVSALASAAYLSAVRGESELAQSRS